MQLEPDQLAAVTRVRNAAGGEGHPYCTHDYNVHRWIVAWGNEDDAAKSLRRHLNIREVMPLPPAMDDASLEMEMYAPVTILGRNREEDNKVVLLEHSGQIDIAGLVDNLRLTAFMRNKFRMMETLQQRVQKEEERLEKQSGGVLIMDLKGLSFSTSLLSVIAGPYRIMWGTLFDQYPQLIQQIIVVNAPTFVNMLYQACVPFIPNDYKDKIVISSGDAKKELLKYMDASCLPAEYGGSFDMTTSGEFEMCTIQTPVSPVPRAQPFGLELDCISIPAGSFLIHKFQWKVGDQLEFYLKNDQEFTYFIFHSEEDTKEQEKWREIYSGCERPALKQCDRWQWTVPHDGYYFIRYGNEKAWLFSVTISCLIHRQNGSQKENVLPIDTFKI